MSYMDKQAELAKLESELIADAALPLRESNLVFGEGNINCDVMFIGEGPGYNEDKLKRPFVGRAGQLLDDLIKGIGWKREDVYITNIIKRRPPENRDPLPHEIEAYKPYLTKQIEIMNPRVIVTLGRFSMNYFLPDAKITRDHGRVLTIGGRIIFPLYHPAAALRSPVEMMGVLKEDFKKLPKILKGELAPEVPPSVVTAVAKKPAKPKQPGLF